MSKIELHISDIRTFKQCRRKWDWSSLLRQNLEPNKPYAPFFTGRAIHHCLEHYYRSNTTFETSLNAFLAHEKAAMEAEGALWPAEQQIINEQVELINALLQHYHSWIRSEQGRWMDDQFKFISLERSFRVPLYNPDGRVSNRIFLAGRFDGVVQRIDDGSFWIWETKTTRSIEELKRSLDNDEQAGAYIIAAQEMFNIHISGVLYNILRKKAPTVPQVLQNGQLSQNKQIDTTAQHYYAMARATHKDWTPEQIIATYGPFIQMLLDKGNTFFARYPVYRTPNELRQLATDLWAVGLEMTRRDTPIYPTPSWMNCNFCHFRAPCLARNAGADVNSILETEFRPRQSWESLEIPEEEMK